MMIYMTIFASLNAHNYQGGNEKFQFEIKNKFWQNKFWDQHLHQHQLKLREVFDEIFSRKTSVLQQKVPTLQH